MRSLLKVKRLFPWGRREIISATSVFVFMDYGCVRFFCSTCRLTIATRDEPRLKSFERFFGPFGRQLTSKQLRFCFLGLTWIRIIRIDMVQKIYNVNFKKSCRGAKNLQFCEVQYRICPSVFVFMDYGCVRNVCFTCRLTKATLFKSRFNSSLFIYQIKRKLVHYPAK